MKSGFLSLGCVKQKQGLNAGKPASEDNSSCNTSSATNDDNVAAKSSTNVAANEPAGLYPVRFNVLQNSTNMDANNSIDATNAPSEGTKFP